jgi:hypothetical protein
MPKDTSTTIPKFTTTYRPPMTGSARLFGFAPIRGIRKSAIGLRLERRFSGPVEKVEEPISEGDTTQWDIDNGFVEPPPGYYWLFHQEPSKTKPHGEDDDVPPPLRPIRSIGVDKRRCKVIRFITGPVERIPVSFVNYFFFN